MMDHLALRYHLLSLAAYPEVKAVVLFGSRAKGTARADSDYDLAVIAEGDYAQQWDKISTVVAESVMMPSDVVDMARASPPIRLAVDASKERVYLPHKWYRALVQLAKALDSLADIINEPDDPKHQHRDSVITRFEYVFELFWKLLKALEEVEGFDEKSPRAAIVRAFQLGWIENETLWLDMLNDRNLSAHSYNEDLARQIYRNIHTYFPELKKIYASLEARAWRLMENC